MNRYILGISAYYHDSAACLLEDGRIVAAAQEERFTRKKHDHAFPSRAVDYCLREGGISVADLTHVAFYDKPWIKFERLLETYLTFAPVGIRSFLKAMPLWLKEKLWMGEEIRRLIEYNGPLYYPEHHESHAASAFFPSPFEDAAILTVDGVGEWATASWGVGQGNRIELQSELRFPHSLGLLYSAFTYYTGFKVNSGEYKVMGLAPYGEPCFADAIRDHLMDLREDGSFRLDMRYFNYCQGLTMTSPRFDALFGGPPRKPEAPITQREMDLARSIQDVTEEVMLRMARHIRKETGQKNLCLAGGVALNCVANGKILREGIFDDIWIQPAAGDAGGALGAALMAHHQYLDQPRTAPVSGDSQNGSLLGPSFTENEIEKALRVAGMPFDRLDEAALTEGVAELLADGKIVGWFQGRMEYGPRALGARSILADPRNPDAQVTVNRKIKFRESFRPFAPSVLGERAPEFFDLTADSPYMLLVAPVRNSRIGGERFDRLRHIDSPVPAITHVDGSARVQTVGPEPNPLYYNLLTAFGDLTGCPVLVNTSFNVRGEPIVHTPENAITCFLRTHMDALAIGPFLVQKAGLPEAASMAFTEEEIAQEYGLD